MLSFGFFCFLGFYSSWAPVKGFTLAGVPADIDVSSLQMEIGFSTLSILITIITTTVCASVPLLMGFRRIKGSNMDGYPGTSLDMSAACHVSTAAAFPRFNSLRHRPTSDNSNLDERDLDPEQMSTPSLPLLQPPPSEVLLLEVPLLESDTDIAMSDLGADTQISRLDLDSPSYEDRQDEEQDDGDRSNGLAADSESQSETALKQQRSDRLQISYSFLRWGEVQMPPSFHERWADCEEPVGHLSFGTQSQWLGEPKEGCLYI